MSDSKTGAGTARLGVISEQENARWIRDMFGRIAPRYDLLNHVLSFNIDRAWRRRLREALGPVLQNPDARVLDLCCGTGDVMFELLHGAKAVVFGADFCHPMLRAANRKAAALGRTALLMEADALRVPVSDESFDAAAIAFGFRNLTNHGAGLNELYRILRGGGRVAILEFSYPQQAIVRAAYSLYSRLILPAIGGLVSGSREAYTYLPDSIREFPSAIVLRDMMTRAGFVNAEFALLSGGIAALHVGLRPLGIVSVAA